MECNFVIGQKVVCIDDDIGRYRVPGVKYPPDASLDGLTKGQVYTVKNLVISPRTGWINVILEEIIRTHYSEIFKMNVEYPDDKQGFHYKRFAPLKERKTNISTFTEILNKVNGGNHDNDYGFNLDELFETVQK